LNDLKETSPIANPQVANKSPVLQEEDESEAFSEEQEGNS
jgi:hypothetical protein